MIVWDKVLTTLPGCLAGEFYGLFYVIILAIYTVCAGTKLMAHLIDNGSTAHLLATPVSRTKIAVTQAIPLIVGIIVIGFCGIQRPYSDHRTRQFRSALGVACRCRSCFIWSGRCWI